MLLVTITHTLEPEYIEALLKEERGLYACTRHGCDGNIKQKVRHG